MEVARCALAGGNGKGLAPGLKSRDSGIYCVRETCGISVTLDLAFEPDVVARTAGEDYIAFIPLTLVSKGYMV